MQAIPFQTPLGLGQLLDRAFRLYRMRFGKLVLTTAIFFVPLGVISSLVLGFTMSSYFELMFKAIESPVVADDNQLLAVSGMTIAASFLIAGLGLILGAVAFLSITAQANANINGSELTIGGSIRAGLRRFWPFVGFSILAALISSGVLLLIYIAVVILALLFAGVVTALSSLSDNSGIIAVGAVFLGIGMFLVLSFLLLLPFIYLTTRWMIAPILILTERCGPVSALSRSWRLTNGSFWRLFGLLFLLVILNGVVLGLPMTLLQSITFFFMSSQLFGLVNGVLTGFSYLVSVLWYPFLALVLVLVYYDLRVRTENLDLDVRIRALEVAVRPSTLPAP